jgi:glycerophosphoryl diester phosphodiesterase
MSVRQLPLVLSCLLLLFPGRVSGATRMVIAENGAGDGLIEHTLPAVTLAAANNVDYLELHVVMTADDELLVYRDLTLNRLSDVADLFPGRNREDGNDYVIDFTLAEIRQLRLRNVFDTGPLALSLGIPTLKEELSLIRRLETLLHRQIGIVLEIKNPWFHRNSGKDISKAVVDTLALFGYTTAERKIFLQCYDSDELQRLAHVLLPEKQMRLPLIQLIAEKKQREKLPLPGTREPDSYDWLFTNIGLRMVSGYAAAIALPGTAIADKGGKLLLGQYIDELHKYGMKVLVLAVGSNKDQLPAFAADFPALLRFYYDQAGIDGIYTDSFVEAMQAREPQASVEKRQTELPPFFASLKLSRPSTAENGRSIGEPQAETGLPENSAAPRGKTP